MEFPDPGSLYSFEDLDKPDDDFRPTPVELIEISFPADGPLPTRMRKALDPDELRAWAGTKPMGMFSRSPPLTPPAGDLAKYCLRLVIVGCDGLPQAASSPKGSAFGFPAETGDWQPPFSRQDCDLIRAKLCLPRATATMLNRNCWAYGVSHFQSFRLSVTPRCDENLQGHTQISSDADGLGITMRLPGSDLVGMDAAISISHWPCNRTTHALLLCRHWCQASYIADMVTHHATMSTHPAAIPSMLCTLYQSALLRKMDITWREVFDIEQRSGQSGIALTHPSEGLISPTGRCDDPRLSRSAIRATQLAAAWDTYVPRVNALVIAVKSFLKSYDKEYVEGNDGILAIQSTILGDYLNLASLRADSMFYRTKHLLSRSKIQVEAINNHLLHASNRINLSLADSSRKVAMDVQRDSSSMKSIALLTMTFLPATYIATLLSTPGLVTTEPAPWLYWTISIPLTAFVLGIWALWTKYSGRKLKMSLEATSSKDTIDKTYLAFPLIPLNPIPEIACEAFHDAPLLDRWELYHNTYQGTGTQPQTSLGCGRPRSTGPCWVPDNTC